MDMTKMDRIRTDDLKLREEVSSMRLERRGKLRDLIDEGMPDIERRPRSTISTNTTARRSAW